MSFAFDNAEPQTSVALCSWDQWKLLSFYVFSFSVPFPLRMQNHTSENTVFCYKSNMVKDFCLLNIKKKSRVIQLEGTCNDHPTA